MNKPDIYIDTIKEFILLNEFEKIYIYRKTFFYITDKIYLYSQELLDISEVNEQQSHIIGIDDKITKDESNNIKQTILYLLVLHFNFAQTKTDVSDIYIFLKNFFEKTPAYNNLIKMPQELVELIYNNHIHFLTSMRRHFSLFYRADEKKRYFQKILSSFSTEIKNSISSNRRIQNIKPISVILEITKSNPTATLTSS